MIKMRKWSDSSDMDAATLAEELEQLLFAVYEVSPWTVGQLEEVLHSDVNSCALAEDENRLVGFLVWQETDFEAEVLQIAVLPSYQGQKIATALFDFLPADKEIFLEVRESNRPALLFYKKEKFEEIARRKAYYHAPVEDAIVMKREDHER
ncbi:ribosomal protein alanine acetyl transferase [Streptococcus sanguinis SK1 = NCTC 7863]|jgi:ribosomal-protein-alanine acetyltransferase|uniref:[Ribosomal protein bS18]-alanine N-acetyltransferase n=2 Tax=Streptococcus sanguinis TaxID=1305 RepID=A0A3P1SAR9_STRSA|nr:MULTISPECIES: ribosomal protein S18-alanine N-acetyltransferase [Streptococcus]EGF05847.1 ribosomal protein alanine acetyl transferase [Streptococcus sanguinis SK1 = NCTC 7863]EGF18342.1 ribosomal protein alanine acetyl transferase [Streptococcus sanguinis SK408]EGF22482.1 ribosomal protein alanine acetyl transferase [Streptococcus sanguinis SK1058]ETD07273.1 ribosomal-protein-alanine acetyltransferase [Streptococcus sanguinis CC94A]MBF1721045.1 ribosomal protein S18-alanine N-acetyltransfe